MLNLVSTSDKVQLITGAAVTVDVHASYIDNDGAGAITPGRKNTAITTAATTDIVASPTTGVFRNVRSVFIRNKHASSSVDVTVQHTDGTTIVELAKFTLSAGDVLEYIDALGLWKVTNPVNIPSPNVSLADQAVGASVTNYLTNSDLRVSAGRPLRVGTVLHWRIGFTKTAAATASMTFDLRVGTLGTTGDTSRGSLATGTQTAVADAGILDIQVIIRSISATGTIDVLMGFYHNLTATGLSTIATLVTDAASGTFDTTATNLIFGVSLTTGASHAITIRNILAEFIWGTI